MPETALDVIRNASLPARQKEKIAEEIEETDRARRAGNLARAKMIAIRVKDAVRSPLANTAVSFIGGAGAEYVRRDLVGRVTEKLSGQVVGLLAVGITVQVVGNIPKGKSPWVLPGAAFAQVGAAHVALAGALSYAALKDKKDNPDVMKIAFEGTSYKHLHPDKK